MTIYRRYVATLDGRGVLFALVADVKILPQHEVVAEVVEVVSKVAWS
jgi:hypothetical protein